MVAKTQEYLEVFSRFKNRESVEAVDRLLNSHPYFEPFEKAQLGSLCCDQAEEAKTLIPRFDIFYDAAMGWTLSNFQQPGAQEDRR